MSKIKNSVPKRTPIEVNITDLETAPWNPRGELTKESVQDLVPSIQSKGLIQRIAIVRDTKKEGKYIVCAGNRRYAACKLAGLTTIPAELFECSEAEARQMTLLENLKRKDAEPIYVADLIKTLKEKDGFTQEEIAAEIGCEVSFVARRAKLINLAAEIKLAVKEGHFLATTDALEKMARYTTDVQSSAFAEIMRGHDKTKRLAWKDIAREFEIRTCDLNNACFARKECAVCPHNSASEPLLWDGAADEKFGCCLDRRCYDLKRKAHEDAVVEKLKSEGITVVYVNDYYSMPEDNEGCHADGYNFACVFRDYRGNQVIRYTRVDPTKPVVETKAVDQAKKERSAAIKAAMKEVKGWEEENLEADIKNRTRKMENDEFAGYMLALAHGYSYTSEKHVFHHFVNKFVEALTRGEFGGIERDHAITMFVESVRRDDMSPKKTLTYFEECNWSIDNEMRKIIVGQA